jgi:hypothetical protein
LIPQAESSKKVPDQPTHGLGAGSSLTAFGFTAELLLRNADLIENNWQNSGKAIVVVVSSIKASHQREMCFVKTGCSHQCSVVMKLSSHQFQKNALDVPHGHGKNFDAVYPTRKEVLLWLKQEKNRRANHARRRRLCAGRTDRYI